MKILCVIDSLGPGGAQRQLVELAKGFKEYYNDVTFLTYYFEPFFHRELIKHHIPIQYIKESNRFRLFFKIRKFIRGGKFDAVISFLAGPNFICECAGIPFRRWKLAVGERNADPHILKSPKQIFFRWFHFFADIVISNSSLNLKYVHTVNPLLKKVKSKVIYNIVDFNIWQPDNNYKFRENSKLKLVIASSHIYRKNANGLIDAMALMTKEELEQIYIEWYGDRLNQPFYDNSLQEVLQKIKKYRLDHYIAFFPATDKLSNKVKKADALGLFSFNEGLPNTVCEAMTCGKPVICSAVSDIPDWLSYDRNLLFDPSDPASIKSSLLYLINSDSIYLRKLGNMNREIAMQNFNMETIISDYLEVLAK